ncbi:MAG: hypothetical protein HRT67_12360 [Flavobacteriaceae bacterium]|nr:hypothetical protein [Flavobacteriaceae bacterium]
MISLIWVFYQDIKARMVYWFLFPIIALCSGQLLYNHMALGLFKITLLINLIFVLFLILVVYVYAKIKLRTSIWNAFGLGDILLFFALTFTFSSISFLVLFIFGLIFALVLHICLRGKSKTAKTVPLAGYLSLFFALGYMAYWLGILKSVYTI